MVDREDQLNWEHKRKIILVVVIISFLLAFLVWEWYQQNVMPQLANTSVGGLEEVDSSGKKMLVVDGLSVIGSIDFPSGSLEGQAIVDSSITGDQLADGSVQFNNLDPQIATMVKDSSAQAQAAMTATEQLANMRTGNIVLTNNSIVTGLIADGAVTGNKIANGTITAEDIATGVLAFGDIPIGSIIGNQIANNTITAANLADNIISSNNIVNSSITSAKIVDGSITAADIAAGVIPTSLTVPDNTITSAMIINGAISGVDIANGTITGNQIANNSISSSQLVDGSITAGDIANGAITATQLASNTIVAGNIVDGTITGIKIANSTITSGLIVDGTIVGVDIANGAISAIQLADSAVTSAKILDGTVTATDIANGAIGTAQLASGAVLVANLSTAAKTQSITVPIGNVVASTLLEQPIFVAPTSGTITKVTVTTNASLLTLATNGSFTINRKSTPTATVSTLDLVTTGLTAFVPVVPTLSAGTSFSTGDVYTINFALGSTGVLSGLLVTIDYVPSD
jgi:hypothetical protein